MKKIKTHLPEFHLEPMDLMTWRIDHDVIHIHIEDVFGIEGLDLEMVIGLTDDGMPSTDEDDIIDSKAVSIHGDEAEYEVESYKTIEILKNIVLPVMEEKFPRVA